MHTQALFGLTVAGLSVSVVFALVADMLGARHAARYGTAALVAAAGAVALAAGFAGRLAIVWDAFNAGGVYSTTVGGILLCAAAVILGGRAHAQGHHALVVAAAGGAALAASARDLVALLICVEIVAVACYALVASARTNAAREAALKYFVQGAVATGVLVLGIAVLGGVFEPGTGMAELKVAFTRFARQSQAAGVGVIALIVGLAFKAGAAPFHSWAPDAYDNAPASSAGIMAGGVKLGMVAALASFVARVASAGASATNPFGLLQHDLSYSLGALAIVSVAVGTTIALTTRSYRRMLAYGGVAQVGYALIALAAFNPPAAIVLAFTYAVATTGAFLFAEAISVARPEWDGSVDGLAGLGRSEKALSAATTLLMMSLAGLPPLLGFWGKFQVIGSSISAAYALFARGEGGFGVWLVVLTLVAALGSVISLGYYGRVIRSLYFGGEAMAGASDVPAGSRSAWRAARWTTIGIAVLVLAIGLTPLISPISALLGGFLFTR